MHGTVNTKLPVLFIVYIYLPPYINCLPCNFLPVFNITRLVFSNPQLSLHFLNPLHVFCFKPHLLRIVQVDDLRLFINVCAVAVVCTVLFSQYVSKLALNRIINLLAPELFFFLILAHPVYKM